MDFGRVLVFSADFQELLISVVFECFVGFLAGKKTLRLTA